MPAILSVQQLGKTYASGQTALHGVDLEIERGEIFALLGPNGAGKTTLISIVCGIVKASTGRVLVGGHDATADYRAARSLIGLVPQELTTDAFETVWNTVSFSRGLFGKAPDAAHIASTLKALSLWEKKDAMLRTLSGGMKRRVMIAKALAHEPELLFLDEPSAGVDVALRRDMWQLVRRLRDGGVTVVLTTHYIEEAEDMADRVGVISAGRLVLVQAKDELMRKLGRRQLTVELAVPLAQLQDLPAGLRVFGPALALSADGRSLTLTEPGSDAHSTSVGAAGTAVGAAVGMVGHGAANAAALLRALAAAGIGYTDVQTSQRSLEEIFVSLVSQPA